jgi:hypothetical protein
VVCNGSNLISRSDCYEEGPNQQLLGFLDHWTEFRFQHNPARINLSLAATPQLTLYLTCISNELCLLAAVNSIATRGLSS